MTRPSDRAVSTVVDVAIALVIVSAAVMVLAVHLEGDDATSDPLEADRTAETLGGTTTTVEYSLDPVVDEFADPGDYDEDARTRVAHGPTSGLVAEAAVANVSFDVDSDPKRLTRAGVDYEDAVDANLREVLFGANEHVQVSAVWRPYAGASIRGQSTVGRAPSSDEDVSSVTMTVPSGIPDARERAIDAAAAGDYDDVGAVVADATIEGYLPPGESQRALESEGLERELVVHRYERMATVVEGADPSNATFRAALERTDGNATAANEYLIDHLAEQIADDLEASHDDPEAAARAVSTGEVELVVRTWNHAE